MPGTDRFLKTVKNCLFPALEELRIPEMDQSCQMNLDMTTAFNLHHLQNSGEDESLVWCLSKTFKAEGDATHVLFKELITTQMAK